MATGQDALYAALARQRSWCGNCGGSGTVWVTGGMWDHEVPDMCSDCEDQWCRLRSCSGLGHHLAGKCRLARKAA